jgi:hypothetical protein
MDRGWCNPIVARILAWTWDDHLADPLPIGYPGFEGRGLALRPSGLFNGAVILCDGMALTSRRRKRKAA